MRKLVMLAWAGWLAVVGVASAQDPDVKAARDRWVSACSSDHPGGPTYCEQQWENHVGPKWIEEAWARKRARDEYRRVYLANRQPVLLISAHICEAKELVEAAQQVIRDERDGAKYSGVVDKDALYQAGEAIRDNTREIKQSTAFLKRMKKAPMPCNQHFVESIVWQYNCSIGEEGCNQDIAEARELVFQGIEQGVDLAALEVERRAKIDPDYLAAVEQWERGIANRAAGKDAKGDAPEGAPKKEGKEK